MSKLYNLFEKVYQSNLQKAICQVKFYLIKKLGKFIMASKSRYSD